MSTAIEFNNISKQYRLGLVSTRTISHDLNRWWSMNIRGKEDPYLKIGEVNDRAHKGESEYVWALKDIDFKVEQGDVLGIIGKNGSGKSTLLKILSKVTTPTTGTILTRGRIASLLEVGTGFHPEMTGRENIYMNGAIMGMNKAEISRKLAEIVDFAGVERYINTPVKRYSSGMMVRLGFAIAAHLEPEILVVDEVLAVGDAEFQKKAIGKMQDVSMGEGRTVLFVSHNMTTIETLCDKICVLQNGMIDFIGDTEMGIKRYLDNNKDNIGISIKEQINQLQKDENFELLDLLIHQESELNNFYANKPISLSFKYIIKKECVGLRIGFDVIDSSGAIIFRSFHDDCSEEITHIKQGAYLTKAEIPPNLLKESVFTISVSIGMHNLKWIIYEQISASFNVFNIKGINKLYADNRPGAVMPHIKWETIK